MLVYKRDGRLNVRRTILATAVVLLQSYTNFTAFEIQEAVYNKSGGEVLLKLSSIRLTLIHYYDKVGAYYVRPKE